MYETIKDKNERTLILPFAFKTKNIAINQIKEIIIKDGFYKKGEWINSETYNIKKYIKNIDVSFYPVEIYLK